MFVVGIEKDKVVLDLGGRVRDLLLDCDMALELANTLEAWARIAEKQPLAPFRGEPWGCKVESYDGKVAIRFRPPLGNPTRVPLPAGMARKLAETIRAKESWARHGMRLEIRS